MSERRFKSQITDVLTEQLPDSDALERWLAPTTESKVEQIPVEQIRDRGWRAEVDTTDPTYRALKASIRASGVLQPLLVRPHPDGGFEVVSGARRLCAARDTVQSTVPAVVRELTDVQALVGGSWDAVLRTGLSARESRDLVAQLVAAGMEEAQASALVGTAPVREAAEAEEVVVEAEVAIEPAGVEDSAGAPAADAAVADAAPVEAVEAVAADQAEAEVAADIVEPEVVNAAVVEPAVVEPAAVEPAVVEPEVVEPAVVDVADAAVDVEAGVADAAEADADDGAQDVPAKDVEPSAGADVAADVLGVDGTGAVTAPAASELVDAHADAELVAAEAELAGTDGELVPADAEEAPEAALAPPSDNIPTGATAEAVAEPEPVPQSGTESEPDVDSVAADFDADVAGWPAPDSEATRTAPTAPPAAIPVDPVVFPVPALESDKGVATVETATSEAPAAEASAAESSAAEAPVADAPSAEAEVSADAPSAEAEVSADEPPAAETPAVDRAASDLSGVAAPAAEAAAADVAPEPEPAVESERPTPIALSAEHSTSTITPHVIPIKLPEPAAAVPSEESDGDDSDSLPVAAPTATEAASGSRLVSDPVPAVRMEPTTPSMRPAAALPSVLRRGPLFYAVLGIGLAVGAIVFILVTVVEGVGSGTTPIIAAVVVAVLGFVSAMISLAQPRERS